MDSYGSWIKNVAIFGTLSIATIGVYNYFSQEEIKEQKKEKKIQSIEPSLIELWVMFSNLKETEKWNQILDLTNDKKDLFSLTFKAEALEHLERLEESIELFKFVTLQDATSSNDEFSIGRSHQQLQNYEESKKWFEKSAEKNHPYSIYSLGVFYQHGIGCEKDEKKALEYLEKSTSMNEPCSFYLLSLLLNKTDKSRSFELLKQAADSNYLPAMITIGDVLSKKDPELSFDYFLKASLEDHPQAQFQVAFCLSNGDGVQKDQERAFEFCKKSADQGHAPAQYLLGGFYHTGSGCTKSPSLAFDYYNAASENGFASAQYS
jgi:TPR repeat protein